MDQGLACDQVYSVDHRVKHSLFFHEPIIHGLLLNEFIHRTVKPLSVIAWSKCVHLIAHMILHLDLLSHARHEPSQSLLRVLFEACHNVAIRLDDLDKLIRRDLDNVSGLAHDLTSVLKVFQLLDGFDGSDGDHLSNVPQIDHLDVLRLILCHVFRVLRISLHGLFKYFLDIGIFKVGLVLVNLE